MENHKVLSQDALSEGRLFAAYKASKYLSIKYDSYFNVYEDVLARFIGQEVTLIEIGVLNGGSLFMWREFLGSQARIVGIDLNPAAKKWEDHGFEIFVGDQASPAFWKDIFDVLDDVDIVIDDGGHTNLQQIVTINSVLPHIRDRGILIVEDVHASYMHQFGNPSKLSFINFSKVMIDSINSRVSDLKNVESPDGELVYSIQFFTSLVVFHVNRKLCASSRPTSNGGLSMDAKDFRYATSRHARLIAIAQSWMAPLMSLAAFAALAKLGVRFAKYVIARQESRAARKYFR